MRSYSHELDLSVLSALLAIVECIHIIVDLSRLVRVTFGVLRPTVMEVVAVMVAVVVPVAVVVLLFLSFGGAMTATAVMAAGVGMGVLGRHGNGVVPYRSWEIVEIREGHEGCFSQVKAVRRTKYMKAAISG